MSSQFLLKIDIGVTHSAAESVDTPLLAIVLNTDVAASTSSLAAVDGVLAGAISRTIARRDFRGNRDEAMLLVGNDSGIQRVLLVGAGKAAKSGFAAARRAAAISARQAVKLGTGSLHILLPSATAEELEGIAAGLALGSWEYADLKTPPAESDRRAPLKSAVVITNDSDEARAAVENGIALAHGQAVARRLGMMPGNVCTPDTFEEIGREISDRHGMKLTVLGRDEMEKAGMGSFLSVAQGTPQEPRLVVLEHRRGPDDQKPVVLVGKGLCFDTGGISIKPAPDMEWMKFDMSGAGGVMGAMETIGRMKLPVNVVGIIGSTTNMPSGTAVKPGDVVRASNGKTIEVINTDAEGRLVLADLLVYASRFNPSVAIDAATLTGAIVIGLGHNAVGVFGSDDSVVSEVLAAGERAGERGWSMPMWDDYRDQIKSDVADLKNTGGRAAGSVTAALFLKEFVDGYPWVHLDIAGTAYTQSDLGWIPRGPTGTPVGTFVSFVRSRVS